LTDPLSASVLMESLFVPRSVTMSGDVPQLPPCPEGAVC
jgi:hypothetical protein